MGRKWWKMRFLWRWFSRVCALHQHTTVPLWTLSIELSVSRAPPQEQLAGTQKEREPLHVLKGIPICTPDKKSKTGRCMCSESVTQPKAALQSQSKNRGKQNKTCHSCHVLLPRDSLLTPRADGSSRAIKETWDDKEQQPQACLSQEMAGSHSPW